MQPVRKCLNIAHRGASGHAPEHTLVAYQKAVQMQADYIEIDLQMTKDGALVAMHDETLDRTTDGSGFVQDHTLADIKRLDAGSWFNARHPEKADPSFVGLRVPTLEEIIRKFGSRVGYYIETKEHARYSGMEEELLRILDKYSLSGKNGCFAKVIIQSFHPESLRKIHRLNPALPLTQLVWYNPLEPGKAVITDAELNRISQYAVGIGPNHSKIDRAYVAKARRRGLLVHPYTVDDAKDMKRLLDWGVTGLFTGYPDVLRDVLKS